MTSAPLAQPAPSPLAGGPLRDLVSSARRASRELRQHPRPAASVAAKIAHTLSDELGVAAQAVGVGTRDGWHLLDLRDRLDSHVLAAAALDGTGVRDDVVLDLIGRAVIDVSVRLTGEFRT